MARAATREVTRPLRLLARDAEDVTVLSACLQDALIAVGDIAWLPQENRFAVVANRFRWEAGAEPDPRGPVFERVHCGLCFSEVTTVRRRGIDPARRDRILELLAIRVVGPDQPAGEKPAAPAGGASDAPVIIDLLFAGGAAIRLHLRSIAAQLSDLDMPWPTRLQPRHEAPAREREA